MKLRLLCAVACLLGLGLSPYGAGAAVSNWQASSVLFPDQINPPYTLFDTASPEAPAFSGGPLRLSTSEDADVMWYVQTAPLIAPPSAFFIETRMRVVSGSTSSTARAAASVLFTMAPAIGNSLFIGVDEIFLMSADSTRDQTAVVDTNDALHTYRIEVTGGTGIQVFQDGVLKLTGATFNSASFNGTVERVGFGEATILAFGTSDWQYLTHNGLAAAAIPEPSTWLLLVSGFAVLLGYSSRRKQQLRDA